MSNLVRKQQLRRRQTMAAMGSLASDGQGSLGDVLSDIQTAVSAASNVASDPYLTEMLCHVQQLSQLGRGQPATPCISTPLNVPGGVGLKYAVVPMRAFVYARQHPWAWLVAAGLVFGVPMMIGYELGRTKRGS